MPLHEMSTQPVDGANGPLEVHRAARDPLREQCPAERGFDGVGGKAAPHDPLDCEAGTIDGDALTPPQPLVGRADREQDATPVAGRLRDPAHRAYDAGKHSRRSKTSNVSGPNARRSTGIQRGASAKGKSG